MNYLFEKLDPNAGYPSMGQAKQMQKLAPKCWELFFGKKYQVPQYRSPHYYRQDFVNYMEWAMLTGLPYSAYRDDVMSAVFCNTAGSLQHGRPTLFLEVELGHPLLRAELPYDMMAEDIKWRWPVMRIYLPKDLITLEKAERHYSLMYLDIGLLDSGEGRGLPTKLVAEVIKYGAALYPEQACYVDLNRFFFHYPDRAIVLSGSLNCIDGLNQHDLTAYAMVKPFKSYTIDQIRKMTDHLKTAWDSDGDDDEVTAKMEHLALQILLFLSAYPLEYLPEQVLRKPSAHGARMISGLYSARFVGRSQLRPERGQPHHIASLESVVAGWHMKHHWRGGHWKRQVCGPGFKDRKLIWINTYEAGEEEEEEEIKS